MKRFKIDIETSYGRGIYDGDVYSDLRIRPDEKGDWVDAVDAFNEIDKMKHRIKRMQKYIDKLEGRSV